MPMRGFVLFAALALAGCTFQVGDSDELAADDLAEPPGDDRDGDGIPSSWEIAHGLDPDLADDALTSDYGDSVADMVVDSRTHLEAYLLGDLPNGTSVLRPGVISTHEQTTRVVDEDGRRCVLMRLTCGSTLLLATTLEREEGIEREVEWVLWKADRAADECPSLDWPQATTPREVFEESARDGMARWFAGAIPSRERFTWRDARGRPTVVVYSPGVERREFWVVPSCGRILRTYQYDELGRLQSVRKEGRTDCDPELRLPSGMREDPGQDAEATTGTQADEATASEPEPCVPLLDVRWALLKEIRHEYGPSGLERVTEWAWSRCAGQWVRTAQIRFLRDRKSAILTIERHLRWGEDDPAFSDDAPTPWVPARQPNSRTALYADSAGRVGLLVGGETWQDVLRSASFDYDLGARLSQRYEVRPTGTTMLGFEYDARNRLVDVVATGERNLFRQAHLEY